MLEGIILIFCFFLLFLVYRGTNLNFVPFFQSMIFFGKIPADFFLGNSGYAHRIHELMAVSRELSVIHDQSLIKSHTSRNYISEANYIEFAGVKVVFFF